MKKRLSFGMLAIMLTTAFLLLSTTSVFAGASDTVAGTTINNKAVLTFNGTTVLESSPAGNTTIGPNQGENTTFVVDRKVRPFVEVEAPGSVNVYAGGTGYVLTFNVMNDGNDDEIFKISLDASTTVSNASFTNPATTSLFIEPTAGIGESLDGDEVPLSSSNYNTATMSPGEIYKVYLVVDHDGASSANNGDTEDYFLIANATVSETGGSDTADSEDVVYADNSGPALEGDNGLIGSTPDGKHSDSGRYVFRTVVLSMQKTETVTYDPYGLDFHLPGVYVQYNVVITNTTGTDPSPAFLTELNDTIGGSGYTFSNLVNPTTGADLGYAFDITVNGSSRAIDGTPQQRSSAIDADNAEEDGSGNITLYFDSAAMTAAGKAAGNEILPTDVANGYTTGELRNGESITIKYNVMIDGALDNNPVTP